MRSADRDTGPTMISRVSEVLRAFQGADRVLGISEISRRTGIPKASVSRIVAEMVETGLLERHDDHIRLGLRLFELGQQAARPIDLRKLALPAMKELLNATGQTVHLAVLEGQEVVYVQILRSRNTPPLASRVGGRLPAYATGVGKALLAHSDSKVVDALLAQPLSPIGPKTITDPHRLRSELEAIRETHIAYEREESTANVGCAAAPIFGGDGEVVAAISVSVHLDLADLTKIGPAVATSAMALSREASRLHLQLS
jgi:IclR family acetate operon transcriptional repressor